MSIATRLVIAALAAGAVALLFFAVIAVGLNWVGGPELRMVWAGH